MMKTLLLGMTISILTSALCIGCHDNDSHQQDQHRQIEGRIQIVQLRDDPSRTGGSPVVFLVAGQDVFSLTFTDDCVIEGLPVTQQGNGYPVTIGGKVVLLHSGGTYSVSGRLVDDGLELSTRDVKGFQVERFACTKTGEGTSYFEEGFRDKTDRLFVSDGCITITVDGDQWQTGGKSNTDIPAPWTRNPEVPMPVIAPFDGTLLSVSVKPGDFVEADEELVKIDSSAMLQTLAKLQTSYSVVLDKEQRARVEGHLAESQVCKAQAEYIAAEIRLIEAKIEHATVRSPVRGLVKASKNELAVGMAVQNRQILFLIYPRP